MLVSSSCKSCLEFDDLFSSMLSKFKLILRESVRDSSRLIMLDSVLRIINENFKTVSFLLYELLLIYTSFPYEIWFLTFAFPPI